MRIFRFIVVFSLLIGNLSAPDVLMAQGKPGTIKDIGYPHIETTVMVLSELNFGTFYPGETGGMVTVDPRGFRTAGGSTILLPIDGIPSPMTVEMTARPHSMQQIVLPRQVILYGTNGGQIIFRPGPLEYGSVFVTPPDADRGFILNMGGTLELGTIEENPPGEYFGSFSFTVVSE